MAICNGVWDGKSCERTVIHARGKCYRCYKIFIAHIKENGSFTPYDKMLDEQLQKRALWTFENPEGEAKLMAEQEAKEGKNGGA